MTIYVVYKTRITSDGLDSLVYFDSAHLTEEQAWAKKEELNNEGYSVTWDECAFNYSLEDIKKELDKNAAH